MIYLPYYFKQIGLSDARIGLLMSLVSLVFLVMVVPFGVLADRLNPRNLFLLGALSFMAFAFFFLKNSSLKWFELYMLLFGLASALSSISLSALFLKEMSEQARGGQSALYNIGGVLGAGLGAELGGKLVGFEQGKGLFLLMLALAILLFLSGWALPKKPGIPFKIWEYKKELAHPVSWILIFVVVIVASHAGFEHAGYTLLQTEVIGLSAKQVGRLAFYLSFWMALITWLSGKIQDRTMKPILWAGVALILSGVFQAVSGYAQGFLDFFLYRTAHTAGDCFSMVLMIVIASLVFAKSRAGGSWAVVVMFRNLSYFLFANLGGVINQKWGFRESFVLSGIIMVLAGILLIFWLRPRFWQEMKGLNGT